MNSFIRWVSVWHHRKKEVRSGASSLLYPWDPTPESEWQISRSPKESDVRDMRWQQFRSAALPDLFSHKYGWCCPVNCGDSNTSVGYQQVHPALTHRAMRVGFSLYCLLSRAMLFRYLKIRPSSWPKKSLGSKKSQTFVKISMYPIMGLKINFILRNNFYSFNFCGFNTHQDRREWFSQRRTGT